MPVISHTSPILKKSFSGMGTAARFIIIINSASLRSELIDLIFATVAPEQSENQDAHQRERGGSSQRASYCATLTVSILIFRPLKLQIFLTIHNCGRAAFELHIKTKAAFS